MRRCSDSNPPSTCPRSPPRTGSRELTTTETTRSHTLLNGRFLGVTHILSGPARNRDTHIPTRRGHPRAAWSRNVPADPPLRGRWGIRAQPGRGSESPSLPSSPWGYPCAAWSRFRVAFLTQFPLGVSVRSLVEGAARQPKHPGTRGICAQPGRGAYFRISASSLMGYLCAAWLRSPRRTSHSRPEGLSACGWGRQDVGWGVGPSGLSAGGWCVVVWVVVSG